MNAAEQRAHRTVTQSLEQRIETIEALLLQVSKNCDYLKAQTDQHTERIQVAQQLASAAMRATVEHSHMTISARLRWLLLGR